MNDKQPRLYFPNKKGEYVAEYMPPNYITFTNWFRWKYIILRHKYGRDIYYWNFRYLHHFEYRKTSDIAFVLHVMKDHNLKPTDRTEKKHFDTAWRLYGSEIQYVLNVLDTNESKDSEISKIVHGHHYANAYKKKWFPKSTEINTKLTYHGINFNEMANYFEQSIEQEKIRLESYYKEQGLDPTTGMKLSIKKQKKSNRKARINSN